ncbi:hypothetical protein BSS2_II1004 [Brucella suis bv. 1 str. S2]|uniref:Uncharacterized protein n=3 Tax=Brucella TaxID=234 RepID=A9MCY2_BRUC2|nr:hypothetical protein BRA1056 [Brucella suis 1330]ABX64219.1 Hypothetical protein, conserved [Brucella canis ATCC 23365]ABY40002.1 Hypothetical protein, conserved [Brucella suis ATCC 23445]AEU08172.1 hypothetical protein BSVBI22_B1047 [Brucella suis VBI22]AHN48766.1 hypothetical protein BSS2_II1004 [Brucella suis bv. 1 str. S2]CDL78577.1 unnamed protein product [Brucella canis str. Oliveri]
MQPAPEGYFAIMAEQAARNGANRTEEKQPIKRSVSPKFQQAFVPHFSPPLIIIFQATSLKMRRVFPYSCEML